MKKLGATAGALIIAIGIIAPLSSLLGTDMEWVFRVSTAAIIVLTGVVIFAIFRERRDSESAGPVSPAPSTFGRGDFSGSIIEGNRSSADGFLDGTVRDATIRNNTHKPKQS